MEKLFVRFVTPWWGPVSEFLNSIVNAASDAFMIFYDWLRKVLLPPAKAIFFRDVEWLGRKWTLCTANQVSIWRTVGSIVFVPLFLKLGLPEWAFGFYCFFAFGDFVDGLVALVHKLKGFADDEDLGKFMDAFCDKFHTTLTIGFVLVGMDYTGASWLELTLLFVPLLPLLGIETSLGVIRVQDFYAKKSGINRLLKAQGSGKFKLACIMVGGAALVLGQTSAQPGAHWSIWVAITFFWVALPLARKSRQEKLDARVGPILVIAK